MLISKTPLRVSFLGGGTDYPSYFENNDGGVLGGTIDKYVYTQALPLASFSEQKFRLTYRAVESVNDADEITHPVVRECLKLYNIEQPLSFSTMSDIPGSTGLGSSSSFTVGFINLLHAINNKEITRYDLAMQAIHLEKDILGENVGVQDQIHAAIGGLSRYKFGKDTVSINPINIPGSRLELFNQSMFLVYTNIQRSASAVLDTQEKRTKAGSNADYLKEMYDMTLTGMKILEKSTDDNFAMAEFGELLTHGWNLKQNLSDKISNPYINEVYQKGIEMGAWGGKLLGAGGGGFVLFLAPSTMYPNLQREFGTKNVMPIKFDYSGTQIIKC